MRYISLFSGGGGGDLAAQHLEGWKCLGYVEWDEYCQRTLSKRQEEGNLDKAPVFGDVDIFIESGSARQYRGFVDVVTGGFPCQSFSVAGSRKANSDPRNKWPATLRVIKEVRPRYGWFENVNGLLSAKVTDQELLNKLQDLDPKSDEYRKLLAQTDARSIRYMGVILRDLAKVGYDAKWVIVSASDVGAPHQRKRWWCFAERREDEGGVSWPTPTATDDVERSADNLYLNKENTPRYKANNGGSSQARLPEAVKFVEFNFPSPSAQEPGWKVGGDVCPVTRNGDKPTTPNERWYDRSTGRLIQKGLSQVVEMFPTPVSSDGTCGEVIGKNDTFKELESGAIRKINRKGTDGSIGLGRYARLFPTPRASDYKRTDSRAERNRDSPCLAVVVNTIYPTPRANDARKAESCSPEDPRNGLQGAVNKISPMGVSNDSGRLNPEWVSWLMGWPIGWTSLNELDKNAVLDWKEKTLNGDWWKEEPAGIPRVSYFSKDKSAKGELSEEGARKLEIKALGNGQVPLSSHVAKSMLMRGATFLRLK